MAQSAEQYRLNTYKYIEIMNVVKEGKDARKELANKKKEKRENRHTHTHKSSMTFPPSDSRERAHRFP